jgi:hypothetical protein
MSRGQKQPSWLRAKTMAEEAQHLSAVKTRKAGLLAETRENENSENAALAPARQPQPGPAPKYFTSL